MFCFLKQIGAEDREWILFTLVWNTRDRGASERTTVNGTKGQCSSREGMSCTWRDWEGVLCMELLPENQTLDSNKHCSQLDRLKAALDEKCLEFVNGKRRIFHQDNTRPHVPLVTRQKLSQPGWEVPIHPLCSPDTASSDFHLFQSLQNSLNGEKFHSLEKCKMHPEQFLKR